MKGVALITVGVLVVVFAIAYDAQKPPRTDYNVHSDILTTVMANGDVCYTHFSAISCVAH